MLKYFVEAILDSSMVEHSAVNRRVVGSSPTRGVPVDTGIGAWLSLVERSVRDREVAGSNPVIPTKRISP